MRELERRKHGRKTKPFFLRTFLHFDTQRESEEMPVRRLCERKTCAYLFTLFNKSQGEPEDTELIIKLMPRSVLSLLDMKQVTGRADTASERCSCCRVVVIQAESMAGS